MLSSSHPFAHSLSKPPTHPFLFSPLLAHNSLSRRYPKSCCMIHPVVTISSDPRMSGLQVTLPPRSTETESGCLMVYAPRPCSTPSSRLRPFSAVVLSAHLRAPGDPLGAPVPSDDPHRASRRSPSYHSVFISTRNLETGSTPIRTPSTRLSTPHKKSKNRPAGRSPDCGELRASRAPPARAWSREP